MATPYCVIGYFQSGASLEPRHAQPTKRRAAHHAPRKATATNVTSLTPKGWQGVVGAKPRGVGSCQRTCATRGHRT